jgi:hypothetical protein
MPFYNFKDLAEKMKRDAEEWYTTLNPSCEPLVVEPSKEEPAKTKPAETEEEAEKRKQHRFFFEDTGKRRYCSQCTKRGTWEPFCNIYFCDSHGPIE